MVLVTVMLFALPDVKRTSPVSVVTDNSCASKAPSLTSPVSVSIFPFPLQRRVELEVFTSPVSVSRRSEEQVALPKKERSPVSVVIDKSYARPAGRVRVATGKGN